MKHFEQKGIAHSVQENATTKYLLCGNYCSTDRHQDAHLHLCCSVSGITSCVESVSFPMTIQEGFAVEELRMFAKGICFQCAKILKLNFPEMNLCILLV